MQAYAEGEHGEADQEEAMGDHDAEGPEERHRQGGESHSKLMLKQSPCPSPPQCSNLILLSPNQICTELEMQMVCDLAEFKTFISNEMIVILGQMDSPTKVFEHVYLVRDS